MTLIFCGGGLYFLLRGLYDLREQQELDRVGQTTEGKIVAHEKVTGKTTRTSLTCAYIVKGQHFRETEYVRPGFYDLVGVGDPITITYAPTRPTQFRTEGHMQNYLWAMGGGILFLMVSVGLGIQAMVFFQQNAN